MSLLILVYNDWPEKCGLDVLGYYPNLLEHFFVLKNFISLSVFSSIKCVDKWEHYMFLEIAYEDRVLV